MVTISLFGLGGTIAMAPAAGGGVVPALTADELVAALPALKETGIELRVRDFRRLPSASLSFTDLFELAEAIDEAVRQGADGVVVTQGTDTIEESAYALDLLCRGARPVVVTGAMRHPASLGADGPANLLAALLTAASGAARGLGCLVVLNDEIHAARWVRKGHTGSPAAFHSAGHGPLGHVTEGRVSIPLRVTPGPPLRSAARRSVRVGLVTVALGDGAETVPTPGSDVDGLIVAAMGAGHVPIAMVPALSELAARVPVVLASRTGAGVVHRATYGFAGSESDLLGRGLISAGHLDPLKARILLHLLLASGTGPEEIAATFAALGDA